MSMSKKLTHLQRRFVNSILSGMNEAIIVTSDDGLVTRINTATAHLLGYDEDELVVVVTVSDNQDNPAIGITANFMAPIVINTSRRIGMQKTLNKIDGGVVIQAR